MFLNACGSSAASFASFFLDRNENRGFIGVETDIEDKLAAAFSKEFYSRFLRGRTLRSATVPRIDQIEGGKNWRIEKGSSRQTKA